MEYEWDASSSWLRMMSGRPRQRSSSCCGLTARRSSERGEAARVSGLAGMRVDKGRPDSGLMVCCLGDRVMCDWNQGRTHSSRGSRHWRFFRNAPPRPLYLYSDTPCLYPPYIHSTRDLSIPTTCLCLHSVCFCSDTVALEQCIAVDQSSSEGHCTLFMQPMSLLCPDPSSSMFQTTAGIAHTAIEKLDCIAPI
jgi:hypothetical protein